MAKEKIENIRHSLAHLLAAAVLELWPDTKTTLGPVIDNGFYYDFDFSGKISDEDLPKVEDKMRQILKTWDKFEQTEVSEKEARKLFKDNPYKQEIIDSYKDEKLTIVKSGSFTDLCRGGHVKSAKNIDPKAFKLASVAGAYWRGSEKNKMLTRIYGVAFETKKELDDYLKTEEKAKERDHRKLGQELKIFAFSDSVGPGLPLWLPNGTVIIEELEKLAKKTEADAGYKQVRTPHIAKEVLYKTSGHLPYYAESMFPPMILEEGDSHKEVYYLKAMNCPHHHQIYAAETRSYRDLPLRLSEYGVNYRYEKSGELFGLMRTRMLSMNDAHIYCTEGQFEEEFRAVNEMYLNYFKIFGIEKYTMRLSTHDPRGLGEKYVDNPELWERTEGMVRKVLKDSHMDFVEVKNEAAFYGPKIDVQVWSSIGREFSIATNQVDFAVPLRFGLTYIDEKGNRKTPIVIHRAPLGTHERTIGFLLEHYAGAFPLWLSPVQVVVAPISDGQAEYAGEFCDQLRGENIRCELYNQNETISKKIRGAEVQKVPYIAVIGQKEVESKSIAVRQRGKGDIGQMKVEEFIEKLKEGVGTKK